MFFLSSLHHDDWFRDVLTTQAWPVRACITFIIVIDSGRTGVLRGHLHCKWRKEKLWMTKRGPGMDFQSGDKAATQRRAEVRITEKPSHSPDV